MCSTHFPEITPYRDSHMLPIRQKDKFVFSTETTKGIIEQKSLLSSFMGTSLFILIKVINYKKWQTIYSR